MLNAIIDDNLEKSHMDYIFRISKDIINRTPGVKERLDKVSRLGVRMSERMELLKEVCEIFESHHAQR